MKIFVGAAAAMLYSGVLAAQAQDSDPLDFLGLDDAEVPQSQGQPSTSSGGVPETASSPVAASDEPDIVETIPVATESEIAPDTVRRPTSRLVEEIVVTAQKREERLQDVPVSVQAFSQEKLDVLGLQSIQDLQRATPGFTVTTAASFNIVFLRGVGSDAFLPGVDSSVPFYLDGVPLLAIQGSSDTLGRVERVEVLKGPQGTLFGRNSTGGAINIVTPDPGPEFMADVKMELGNWNTRNVTAYVNAPLTDGIAFNLSGFNNERDNNITQESSCCGGGVPVYARGGRLKLGFEMGSAFTLTLNGTYQEVSSNGGLAFQLVRPAPILSAGGLVLTPDPAFDRNINIDGPFGAANKSWLYGGTLLYSGSAFDSKLIYAKQHIESPYVYGHFDGAPQPLVSAEVPNGGQNMDQDTIEWQFLSNAGSPFSDSFTWVGGLFYLKSLGGFKPITFSVGPNILQTLLPGGGGLQLQSFLDGLLTRLGLTPLLSTGLTLANSGLIYSESYSAYAQGTYTVTDSIDFTAGIRYQIEERKLLDSGTEVILGANGGSVPLPVPQGARETLKPKQTSLRFALQWKPFGPDDQLYASWARGYKSPTYNTVNLLGNIIGTMVEIKAERVDTAELGVKTNLLDGALQLNAAAFYTVQKNPLSSNVNITSGGIANFTNAGEAVIKGVDGDFLLLPMPNMNPGLALTGGFSYLDAIYTSFVNGRGFDDETGLGFGGGLANTPARDLSGNRIPRVPEWSWTLGINQRIDGNSGRHALEMGASAAYTSDMYFLPQNSELSKRDPVTLFNAHLSYFYVPWNIELTAYCNNLTDELFVDTAFVTDFGTALIANDDPRMYGLRFKWSF